MHVRRQVIERAGILHPGPPKSAVSRRTLALDTQTVVLLREYRARQILDHGEVCQYVFADPPVLVGRLTDGASKCRGH